MVYEKLFCQIFVKYQLSGIMDNAVASCVHGYELTAPNVCMCLRHIPTMPSVLKVNLIYGGVIDTLLWPMGRSPYGFDVSYLFIIFNF